MKKKFEKVALTLAAALAASAVLTACGSKTGGGDTRSHQQRQGCHGNRGYGRRRGRRAKRIR